MKCPKCGYTSFDYLDSCKKCNNALRDFKAKYNLRSLLFPNRTQQSAAPVAATLAAAALAPAPAASAEGSDSTDFGYDFDSATPAAAAAPVAAPMTPPAAAAADSFDFDSDWDAPAAPVASAAAAENADDSFDFMADSPEPSFGIATVGDELDLDLGEESIPPAAAEETSFSFDDSWGESALDQAAPAAVASLTEEPLAEFSAETLDFTDSSADEAISFNDEFDFADDEMPDLLSSSEESAATAKKLGATEGPSDPFDQRESAPAGPAPVASAAAVAALTDQPEAVATLDREPDAVLAEQAIAPAEPVSDDQYLWASSSDAAADESAPELDAPDLAEEPEPANLRPAGAPFFRLGAGALDLMLLVLIYVLFLAAGKLALFPASQAMAPIPLEALLDLAIPYFLLLFTLCFGYFTVFHFLSGQTPGKMIFRLKVESVSGAPIDFAQAFLRSVGGLLSLLCAGIGFLFIFLTPEHRGWNDRLAGTRVIETGPPLAERD